MKTFTIADKKRFGGKYLEKNRCWVWQSGVGRSGYAIFWHNGKQNLAHRISYQMFVGDIPEGLVIDHLCSNTICVNPLHLEAVTQRENLKRSTNFISVNINKIKCTHGHKFTSINTYLYKGHRYCKKCRNESIRRFRGHV